jgi:branched-chain amino acid transport system ATP-binding protein
MHSLDIAELTVHYGRAVAVDRASVQAPGGTVTCLVGPNGAGKSSIILAAYGAVRSNGSVMLDGEQIAGTPSVARARTGLAIVPQGRQLFPRLTVRENMQVYADMLKLPSSAVDSALDRFPILRERARRLAGILSGGEQQMLVVSRALMTQPRAILLDEIMTGLAPRIVESLVDVVRDLTAEGIAVLMAEPSIHAVRGVLDRGYVMIRGRIVDVGEEGGIDLDERYQRAMGVAQRVPAEAL